jgi:hypothetical protein
MLTLKQWLALAFGLVLIGFIVFAFRKGTRVKPDDSGQGPPPDASRGRFTGSTDESDGGSHS